MRFPFNDLSITWHRKLIKTVSCSFSISSFEICVLPSFSFFHRAAARLLSEKRFTLALPLSLCSSQRLMYLTKLPGDDRDRIKARKQEGGGRNKALLAQITVSYVCFDGGWQGSKLNQRKQLRFKLVCFFVGSA
jgi:hypothetical protein